MGNYQKPLGTLNEPRGIDLLTWINIITQQRLCSPNKRRKKITLRFHKFAITHWFSIRYFRKYLKFCVIFVTLQKEKINSEAQEPLCRFSQTYCWHLMVVFSNYTLDFT